MRSITHPDAPHGANDDSEPPGSPTAISSNGLGAPTPKHPQHGQRAENPGETELPPPKKMRLGATLKRYAAAVINLSIEHPGWGCIRLSRALQEQGIAISPPTVQRILNKNNLKDKTALTLQLETWAVQKQQSLTPDQAALIEKFNPCFRERFQESSRPGEILVQDTFLIGKFHEVDKLYLQTAVDTYNHYAFCLLHVGKFSDYAVALLYQQVIPFYQKLGLTVGALLTDNGREYCGKDHHHFELYLQLNAIEHRYIPSSQEQPNGYIKRFHQTIFRDFFRPNLQKHFELTTLQAALAQWLCDYNTQKPIQGYRNLGKTPAAVLNVFLSALTTM